MRIDTRNIVSTTEAGRTLGAILARNETVLVVKNNTPTAAIVPIGEMERLEDLDERESDVRLLALAYAREITDAGVRHSLDDVLTQQGINSNDLFQD